MSDRHPMIYNEFDIEAARKAGRMDERLAIIRQLQEMRSKAQESNRSMTININALITFLKGEDK